MLNRMTVRVVSTWRQRAPLAQSVVGYAGRRRGRGGRALSVAVVL